MKKIKFFFLFIVLLVPIVFVACENSNKNTLSRPEIVKIENGTIVFNQVDDAESYIISINDETIEVNPKYNNSVKIINNQINYDANKIFVVGESYSVKIKARANKHADSDYSNVTSYKHITNIEKVKNVRFNSTILTWDTVENASFYLVKVLTPYDKVLDEYGNSVDDSESVAKADLTEYSFSNNQFDFSTILTMAGEYKFYICAVRSDGVTYVQSGYTTKVTYVHKQQLKTPIISNVVKQNNEIYMALIVDENTNNIIISCNDVTRVVNLQLNDSNIYNFENNIYYINISNLFQYIENNENIDVNALKLYLFTAQAQFLTTEENNYYIDSQISNTYSFNNTQTLESPALTYNKNATNYLISWANTDAYSYKLYILNSTGLTSQDINSDVYSIYVNDFTTALIKSEGTGNYLNSNLSAISNSEKTKVLPDITTEIENNVLTFTLIEDAKYLVEINNQVYISTENSFDFSNINNVKDITLYVLKDGYQHKKIEISVARNIKLKTPTNLGFTGSQLYTLTFDAVEKAVGYYVYIKSQTSSEFTQIDNLYTTNTINLSQYINRLGEYTNYYVKVQAVADKFSDYVNSDLSDEIEVSHTKKLDAPQFYKIGTIDAPVTKENVGNITKYYVNFYGVKEAIGYELLVNYVQVSVDFVADYIGLYKVDVSNYMVGANEYNIRVRAIANTQTNVMSSDYNIKIYVLTKQLEAVQDLKITETDGQYTLSFTPQDNARAYSIRIVKYNDNSYANYLYEQKLSNPFEVISSADVTNYVRQQGQYYFYVTTLAKKNGYYGDSNESAPVLLDKSATLTVPSGISFTNINENEYILSWLGDENADYYRVKIVNPNNFVYEFSSFTTNVNINKYITIQGKYEAYIYSMISANSGNSKEYTSSSAGYKDLNYIYTEKHDFLRYSINIYGEKSNFVVTNAQTLKNLLWYHYLYKLDENYGLKIYLELSEGETIRSTIKNLAVEASANIYSFDKDNYWLNYIQADPSSISDNVLFTYLCKKLLSVYPDLNELSNFELTHDTGNQVFKLFYLNSLNATKTESSVDYVEKVKNDQVVYKAQDFANKFTYLEQSQRRNSMYDFKIEEKQTELVTTTEQLLQVVMFGKKPQFYGVCETAELTYNNAKKVLQAIVNNNMTDVEKATKIFDWLEYAYTLNQYAKQKFVLADYVDAEISIYGIREEFYLEGIFKNLFDEQNSNFDGEFYLGSQTATNYSYSKAFSLLCAIEGIDTRLVYGESLVGSTDITEIHVWNKIKLNISNEGDNYKWYAVDITKSDNQTHRSQTYRYGISSHTYFLTSDTTIKLNAKSSENMTVISPEYANSLYCEEDYDYYGENWFTISNDEVYSIFLQNIDQTLSYKYLYDLDTQYYKYSNISGYGNMQTFIYNLMLKCKVKLMASGQKQGMFEFQFVNADFGNSGLSNSEQPSQLISRDQYLRLKCQETYTINQTFSNQRTNIIVLVTTK